MVTVFVLNAIMLEIASKNGSHFAGALDTFCNPLPEWVASWEMPQFEIVFTSYFHAER